MNAPRHSRAGEPDEATASHPEREAPSEQRRAVLFVVAHVAAVGGIYLLAMVLGGGLAPPPFPPDLHATAQHWPVAGPARAGLPTAALAVPERVPRADVSPARQPTGLPAWAQLHDAAPPWEGR